MLHRGSVLVFWLGGTSRALLWLALALKLVSHAADDSEAVRSVRRDIAACLARQPSADKGTASPTPDDTPEHLEAWAKQQGAGSLVPAGRPTEK